jgi:hypothetical protein
MEREGGREGRKEGKKCYKDANIVLKVPARTISQEKDIKDIQTIYR